LPVDNSISHSAINLDRIQEEDDHEELRIVLRQDDEVTEQDDFVEANYTSYREAVEEIGLKDETENEENDYDD